MKRELIELERLDLAARAQVTEAVVTYGRVAMIFVSGFVVLLAIESEASFYETLSVRVLAVLAALTTVLLWFRWRYSVHAWTVVFFAVGIGSVLFDRHSHTVLGWSAKLVYVLAFAVWGYELCRKAMPFAVVNAKGWEQESSKAQQWLNTVRRGENAEQVLEFSTGSFWTGYCTYALLNTGYCWVIAKFKTGNRRRLLEYRIREAGAVRVTRLSGETLGIKIGNHAIRHIKATPNMHARLSRLASQES
jgi:hypothetical protein